MAISDPRADFRVKPATPTAGSNWLHLNACRPRFVDHQRHHPPPSITSLEHDGDEVGIDQGIRNRWQRRAARCKGPTPLHPPWLENDARPPMRPNQPKRRQDTNNNRAVWPPSSAGISRVSNTTTTSEPIHSTWSEALAWWLRRTPVHSNAEEGCEQGIRLQSERQLPINGSAVEQTNACDHKRKRSKHEGHETSKERHERRGTRR